MRYSLLILLALIFGANVSLGQKGQSESTLKFEFLNGYWLATVKAQNGMASETYKLKYSSKEFSHLEVSEFHAYYKDYLLDRISISVDSIPHPLNNVSLEINSAKANGQFISSRRETAGSILHVKSNAFEELGNHKTKLIIVVEDQKHVAWLTTDNNYSAIVKLK